MTTPLKPLVKWSGGKGDELAKIMEHIPSSYETYIEPFVGGGALLFHLRPEKAVISDVHKELVDFYKAMSEGKGGEISEFMDHHPNDEATYYKVRD
jgi:DNA adenine methylase